MPTSRKHSRVSDIFGLSSPSEYRRWRYVLATKPVKEKLEIQHSSQTDKPGSKELSLDVLWGEIKKIKKTLVLLEEVFSSSEENMISRLSGLEVDLKNLSYRWDQRFGRAKRNCPDCGKLQYSAELSGYCEHCGASL